MSFKSQLDGFIKRNFKLKFRNKAQLISEIYNPTIILVILILFNYLFKNQILPAASFSPEDLNKPVLYQNVYVFPDNKMTKSIIDQMSNLTIKYRFQMFEKLDDMKSAYLKEVESTTDIFWGIEFPSQNFPYEYKLYHKWDDVLFANNEVKLTGNGNLCRPDWSGGVLSILYYDCNGNKLVYDGFSFLQSKLDYSIKKVNFDDHWELTNVYLKIKYAFFLKAANNSIYEMPSFQVENMPKKEYVEEQMWLTALSAYYFTIFFIYSLISFTTNVVMEKEKKIKEAMRMMGMYDSAFW